MLAVHAKPESGLCHTGFHPALPWKGLACSHFYMALERASHNNHCPAWKKWKNKFLLFSEGSDMQPNHIPPAAPQGGLASGHICFIV